MDSRERLLTALNFKEPDRVPIDLGSTHATGIMAHALTRLKKYLGVNGTVRVYELFQMLGEVEMEVLDKLSCDVLPLDLRIGFFSIPRTDYKPWKLWDGTDVLVPGKFCPFTEEDGSLIIREGNKPDGNILGRMPRNGFYFDIPEKTDIYTTPEIIPIDKIKSMFGLVTDEELNFLSNRAKELRKTDKGVVAGLWGVRCGGEVPRGGLAPRRPYDRVPWMYLLATERNYCKEVMDAQIDVCLENARRYSQALGDNIDVVAICGEDYGTQKSPMISPEVFREVYVPSQKRVCDWLHANTPWKTFFHSCGSVYDLIEGFIEMGADIINPVQCSAGGMEPERLKKNFDGRIVFWGGGVDTQKTLPFGTPDEVRKEVRERIRVFASGGGFVFCPVHNIQQNTPPENIIAAYETAKKYGEYGKFSH